MKGFKYYNKTFTIEIPGGILPVLFKEEDVDNMAFILQKTDILPKDSFPLLRVAAIEIRKSVQGKIRRIEDKFYINMEGHLIPSMNYKDYGYYHLPLNYPATKSVTTLLKDLWAVQNVYDNLTFPLQIEVVLFPSMINGKPEFRSTYLFFWGFTLRIIHMSDFPAFMRPKFTMKELGLTDSMGL